jgi:uncharacterized membrane protein YiaA
LYVNGRLSAYLLGEFGHLIYYKITQEKQYKALCYHLYDMDPDVIMIFLIALLKVGYDNERIINKVILEKKIIMILCLNVFIFF